MKKTFKCMTKTAPGEMCKSCGCVHKSEKKGKDLEKLMPAGAPMPGSVATTGGPSIASQIGFGKAEENPDKEADAELGEKIEEAVEEHMKENEEAEKEEGHKIRFEKGMSWNQMKKKESELDEHMKELQKTPKIDQGKTVEQKRARREQVSPFKDNVLSDLKGINPQMMSTDSAKIVGEEQGPLAEKKARGQSQMGAHVEMGKKKAAMNIAMDNLEGMMRMPAPKLPKDAVPKMDASKAPKGALMRSELKPGQSYNDLKKASAKLVNKAEVDEEEDARQAAEEYSEKVARPHSKAKQQAKDLKNMKERSTELEKAKVDEGKSDEDKIKAREERNVRNFASKKPNIPRGGSYLGVNAPSKSDKKGESIVGDYARGSKPTGPFSGEHSDSRTKSDLMNQAKNMVSSKIKETKNSPRVNLGKAELQPGMSYADLRKAEAELAKAESETAELANTIKSALDQIRSKLKK